MELKIFREIGFTDGEIRVYIALTELGDSTIGPIAKYANITPSKVYPILDKLKNKGLITYIMKNGVKVYQLFEPERLLNYLDNKKEDIETQKQEIEKLIPLLKPKKATNRYATIYEGYNGIKTLFDEWVEDLSKSKEDYKTFSLGKEYKSKDAVLFFKNFDAKKREFKIKSKIICSTYQKNFISKIFGEDPDIEFRFLDQALPNGLGLFGNKVVQLVWKDSPIGFVIQSKHNSDVYNAFFEQMWNLAKK